MTHYIALTCAALARQCYALAATVPQVVSVRLLAQGLHNTPRLLRACLQAEIDAIAESECEAILLAYGLCGTATLGLTARHTPLVIPRVHDCVTLYLGSRTVYEAEFAAHPGTYWYSRDYLERNDSLNGLGASLPGVMDGVYETYVEKYGKDNAAYLMEVMGEWQKHYDRAVFIDTGFDPNGEFEAIAREQAHRRGWLFERRTGGRQILAKLLQGTWDAEDFLVVPPGYAIHQNNSTSLIDAIPAQEIQ